MRHSQAIAHHPPRVSPGMGGQTGGSQGGTKKLRFCVGIKDPGSWLPFSASSQEPKTQVHMMQNASPLPFPSPCPHAPIQLLLLHRTAQASRKVLYQPGADFQKNLNTRKMSYRIHINCMKHKKINVSFLSEMSVSKSELLMPVGVSEWNIHLSLMAIFWLTT